MPTLEKSTLALALGLSSAAAPTARIAAGDFKASNTYQKGFFSSSIALVSYRRPRTTFWKVVVKYSWRRRREWYASVSVKETSHMFCFTVISGWLTISSGKLS